MRIPEEPRISAEAAIESAASYISVFSGSSCQIWSPRLPVAFHAHDDHELEPLRGAKGLVDAGFFVPGDTFTASIEPGLISSLSDRDEGVTLLASALATSDLAGSYRELLRVFERAFARSSNKLVWNLAKFLESRPALGYSKSEIKKWIVGMRGAAVHADRKRPLLTAADYRLVVHRMLFAAYDVLINKQHWHDPSAARRNIWEPTYGPEADGGIVGVQGREGLWGMEMLDGFSAFKMSASSPNFRLGDDFWPQTGPQSMSGRPQAMKVVAATDFAPE